MGQQMLNLMPMPNGVINQADRSAVDVERWQELTPSHKRIGFVSRIDAVLSAATRFSVKTLYDNDTIIDHNRVAPGVGSVTNVKPGTLVSGAFSQVLSSSMVHEVTVGWQMKHFGFRIGTGIFRSSDYTSLYESKYGS